MGQNSALIRKWFGEVWNQGRDDGGGKIVDG